MFEKQIRENRLWVAIVEGRSEEKGIGFVPGFFVKFELPEVLPNGRVLENTKGTAVWYYLNVLDHFSTMSDDRMFNASDIYPSQIVELAKLKVPYWEKTASV